MTDVDPLLVGLPAAIALVTAVQADPTAPLTAAVVGPGGSGKSALLGAALRATRRAGAPVRRLRPGDGVPFPDEDPALLLVDDAHRLDDTVLRALTDVADDPDARLVVTARPWPRPRTLSTLLVSLGRARATTALVPLTPSGVGERASASFGAGCPPALVAALARLSGGHTAVVDRLLAAARDGGPQVVSATERSTTECPTGVVDLLRHEVEGLDAATQRLLLALAVDAPRGAALADVLEVERTTLEELLDRARSSGLLLPAVDGDGPPGGRDRLSPLVRGTLLRLGPADERLDLERRVAEQALARGAPVLDPARRLLGAGLRGPETARVFVAAGDEALRSAPHLAATLYADAVAAGAEAESVVLRRAEAAALEGDLDTALRLADPLTTREGDDGARAVAVVATVLAHRGSGRTATAMLAEVPRLRPWAVLGLVGAGDPERARRVRVEAEGSDGAAGTLRSAVLLAADGVLTSLGPDEGAAAAALSELARAATLMEPLGAGALLPESPAALAALVALHAGDLDVAESVLRRAIETAPGGPVLAPRHHLLRAWIAMLRADVVGVRDHVAEARALGDVLEPRDELTAAAIEIGVHRRTGDSAALRAAWGRAREALVRYPVDLFALLPLGEIVVGAARLREQASVRPAWEAAEALLVELGDPPLWRVVTSWYGLAGALTAEQVPDAARHLAALEDLAGRLPVATALAGGARVWVAALGGEVDPVAVEAAARAMHQLGWTWDATRLAGEAAIRTRDRKALATLLACARSLADTGRPGPDGTSAQPTGVPTSGVVDDAGEVALSDREREVARLVLAGLTQKQIGARLYISAKTVEHHVARMRQRLGSTSRGELFAQLRDLVGEP